MPQIDPDSIRTLKKSLRFPPGFASKQPVGGRLKGVLIALAALQLLLAIVRVANESDAQFDSLPWTVVYLVLEFAGFLCLAVRPGFAWIPFVLECAVLFSFTSPGAYAFLLPVFLLLACYVAPLISLIPISLAYLAWMFGWPTFNEVSLVDFVPVYGLIWLISVFIGLSCRIISVRERDSRQRLSAEELSREHAINAHKSELARELHDVIAHHLTIIAVRARVGERNQSVDALQEELHDIGNVSRTALADLRNLLATMREESEEARSADSLANVRLDEELDNAVDALAGYGIECEVTIEGEIDAIPMAHRPTLQRFIRECVTNVLKHAAPKVPVSFVLNATDADTTITSTNGVGPSESTNHGIGDSGYGLLGLRERAVALDGSVKTRLSPPGRMDQKGVSGVRTWTVMMTLPRGPRAKSGVGQQSTGQSALTPNR